MTLASNNITRTVAREGKYNILSPPIAGAIYMCGIDPIPFGDREMSAGSDWMLLIGDVISGEIVATYSERNMDSFLVCSRSQLLQEYYACAEYPNGAPAMMEMNRGEVAYKEYKDAGKLYLLNRKATHLGHEFKDAKSRYGWNKGTSTEGIANDQMIKFLQLHADKIRFQRGVDELKRFPDGNNDWVDAFRGFCINWGNYTKKIQMKYDHPKTRKLPFTTWKNGKTVIEYREVPYEGQVVEEDEGWQNR